MIAKSIVMAGLDNSGKTTLLYRLKLGEAISTVPTNGSNIENFNYKNFSFRIWDLGGRSNRRAFWPKYYENAQALIYVVDSTDTNRVEEARGELHKMLAEDQLKKLNLLIYANKQDLPEAITTSELAEKLALH